MKKESYKSKGRALREFHQFQEYETEVQQNLRMVIDLIREIEIDMKIESRKAIKC